LNTVLHLSGMVARIALIAAAMCASSQVMQAQSSCAWLEETVRKLYTARDEDLDALWKQLITQKGVPLTCDDSVVFLYRGDAHSVNWLGDFNAWGYDKEFNSGGKRIPNSDIWILKASLPRDARLDYKIFLNNRDWLLDPLNTANQWSGVGGGSLNSQLQMPEWKADTLTGARLATVAPGLVENDLLFNSRELGYQITYSVYYPPGYQSSKGYTILYVTDGYEYMHERMGNMVTILDNLIGTEKIPPVIAVFIDHREPANRFSNRRMTELSMNDTYLNFITREFIPQVEGQLHAAPYPRCRAIIGNSAGGLFAAWLAFSRPELFPLAGIESPSFSFQPKIYSFCETSLRQPSKIFMTSGLMHDGDEATRKMKDILLKRSCIFEYREVNEGHSWGNWRDLTDDLLVYLLNDGKEH
jgi:enterochelin esterase family protein